MLQCNVRMVSRTWSISFDIVAGPVEVSGYRPGPGSPMARIPPGEPGGRRMMRTAGPADHGPTVQKFSRGRRRRPALPGPGVAVTRARFGGPEAGFPGRSEGSWRCYPDRARGVIWTWRRLSGFAG